MKFDAFVAGRYLRAKRKQAFIGVISSITLLGISLGVGALNIALAIHNGMRQAFVQSLVGETGQLHIVANRSQKGFPEQEVVTMMTALTTLPGVKATSIMRQEAGVLISKRKRLSYGKLIGIMPEQHLKASETLHNMVSGEGLAFGQQPLTQRLAVAAGRRAK